MHWASTTLGVKLLAACHRLSYGMILKFPVDTPGLEVFRFLPVPQTPLHLVTDLWHPPCLEGRQTYLLSCCSCQPLRALHSESAKCFSSSTETAAPLLVCAGTALGLEALHQGSGLIRFARQDQMMPKTR